MPNRLAPSTGPNAPGFWMPHALIKGGTAKAATVMSKPSTMITRKDTTTSWKLKALSLRLSMKSVTSVVCEVMWLSPSCRRSDRRVGGVAPREGGGNPPVPRPLFATRRLSRWVSPRFRGGQPTLLRFRPRAAHDVRPLDFFPVDVGRVVSRPHPHALGAVGGDARLHVRRRDRGTQRGRELVHDRLGGAGRRHDAVVENGRVTG